MKSLISLLFLLISFNNLYSLEIGDNLRTYFEQNKDDYIYQNIIEESVNGWVDSTSYIFSRIEVVQLEKVLIYLNSDKIPYAVNVSKLGTHIYIWDIDGDGILDFTSEEYLMPPYWCMPEGTPGVSGRISTFETFYLFIDLFQSDEGPSPNNPLQTASNNALAQAGQEPNRHDRDILYAMHYFFAYGRNNPYIAINNMIWINEIYLERYTLLHPLPCLFQLEKYITIGDRERALVMIDILEDLHPGLIPTQVHKCRLEKDPEEQNSLITELHTEYPNHWLVGYYYNEFITEE